MNSPSSSSSDGPTAEEEGAKEYVDKVSYYKALIREEEGLQRQLLKIARLLDKHKNDTKRVKTLEDGKASYERRLNQVNHWQDKTKTRMEWLRGQYESIDKGRDASGRNAPESESADGSGAAEKDACEKNDGVA